MSTSGRGIKPRQMSEPRTLDGGLLDANDVCLATGSLWEIQKDDQSGSVNIVRVP